MDPWFPSIDLGQSFPPPLGKPVAGRNTETKGIRKRRRATSLGRHVSKSRDHRITGEIFSILAAIRKFAGKVLGDFKGQKSVVTFSIGKTICRAPVFWFEPTPICFGMVALLTLPELWYSSVCKIRMNCSNKKGRTGCVFILDLWRFMYVSGHNLFGAYPTGPVLTVWKGFGLACNELKDTSLILVCAYIFL